MEKLKMPEIRPEKILAKISSKYPQAWKQIDLFLEAKGKDIPKWPDWCFMPLAAAYAIVSGGGENRLSNIDQSLDVGVVGAMATWRLSKGIYRFDRDLFQALWDTPLNHELPIDLFYRLPEYCLYIETPGKNMMNNNLHGFFVHLEHDINDGHVELRILLDFDSSPFPCPIHLDQEGILKSVSKAQEYSALQAQLHAGIDIGIDSESAKMQSDEITPLISLILYICSTNAEMINKDGMLKPNKPQAKKIKKGKKFFAAKSTMAWDVGLRIGATIRSAQSSAYSPSNSDSTEKRRSPITHPRTSHWQTYWTGKGRTRPEVKWKNMMIVNPGEEINTTLHKVEK